MRPFKTIRDRPASGSELVVLVDEADNVIGVEDKLQAHIDGALHRAISVFLFDSSGNMLIQRRAEGKYHTAGLWSNACCSHPKPGESVADAAHRRLKEEMGVETALQHVGILRYLARFDDLVEHEYDHLFLGQFDQEPHPDPSEVSEWKWISLADLEVDLVTHPLRYTPWFRAALGHIVSVWSKIADLSLSISAARFQVPDIGADTAVILPLGSQ